MSKKLIPIVMTIFLLLSTSFVYAGPINKGPKNQAPGKSFPQMKGPHGKMMGKGCGLFFEIGLSDKQIEKIMTLKHKRQVKLIPVQRELRELAEEGKTLKDDPLTNQDRLVAIAERAGELKTQLKVNKIEGRAEMLSVLTAEQRTLLDEKKAEMKTKMKERRGGRGNKSYPNQMGYDFEEDEDAFVSNEMLYPEIEFFEE